MAHVKSGGRANPPRDSNPKYRGIKVAGGSAVLAGNIIVRQKGTKYFPGKNVRMGKDYTIFSTIDGIVRFQEKKQPKFDGRKFKDTLVHVDGVE